MEAVLGPLDLFELVEAAGESDAATAEVVAETGEISDLVAEVASLPAGEVDPQPAPEETGDILQSTPELAVVGFGHEDPDYDPWCGWPGPSPEEVRRQPRLVVDNPPPELSDAELVRLLPPKGASATAVGWEIRAHNVLRARRVEWFCAQRLVKEQSAAHDWRQSARAAVAPSLSALAPPWARRLLQEEFHAMETRR